MPKQKKLPIVLIQWRDITDFHGWNDLSDPPTFDAAICHSVGFLIDRSRKQVQIVETISPGESNEAFGNIKCIPTGCIISIKKLS